VTVLLGLFGDFSYFGRAVVNLERVYHHEPVLFVSGDVALLQYFVCSWIIFESLLNLVKDSLSLRIRPTAWSNIDCILFSVKLIRVKSKEPQQNGCFAQIWHRHTYPAQVAFESDICRVRVPNVLPLLLIYKLLLISSVCLKARKQLQMLHKCNKHKVQSVWVKSCDFVAKKTFVPYFQNHREVSKALIKFRVAAYQLRILYLKKFVYRDIDVDLSYFFT